MIGNNSMTVCIAQMVEIVQYWLENVHMKQCDVQVSTVGYERDSFKIELTRKEDKKRMV